MYKLIIKLKLSCLIWLAVCSCSAANTTFFQNENIFFEMNRDEKGQLEVKTKLCPDGSKLISASDSLSNNLISATCLYNGKYYVEHVWIDGRKHKELTFDENHQQYGVSRYREGKFYKELVVCNNTVNRVRYFNSLNHLVFSFLFISSKIHSKDWSGDLSLADTVVNHNDMENSVNLGKQKDFILCSFDKELEEFPKLKAFLAFN